MSDDLALLQQRVKALESELEERRAYIAVLEKANKELEEKVRNASAVQEGPAPLSDLEETLRRFIARVAMILQAEKAVFMTFDKESGELIARKPALGFTDDQIRSFRVRATEGVSGQVFRERKPYVMYDALNDERTLKENVALLGIRNGVTVPLIEEKRDEENRVIEERPIGVLHVFNKRYGNIFIEEDLRLLERLAKNAAAVIANAQLYQEVVEEKEQLESIIESVYAGLIMVGKQGHIQQINPSARDMLGLDGEDVQGRMMEEVIKEENVLKVLTQSIKEQTEIAQEISVKHDPGEERIFQVQTALVKGDDQSVIGAVAIFNDITEIRSVERMKTAFVSTVSHELRTPLTSIKGFISTLLADVDGYYDEATRREFYTIIDTECDRLTRLISDLLNVSRIEAGRALQLNLKPVNLKDLCEKVIMAQSSYTSKHELVLDLADDIPEIIADEDKVDQILTNLTNNAIKYSPKGGVVTIKGRREDGYVVMSVMDQGIGIPKEHLSKVFDRFHRVDNRDTREAGGTGIGLFLVKALVEAHHGEIWVESEVGKGSSFIFKLPENPQIDDVEG